MLSPPHEVMSSRSVPSNFRSYLTRKPADIVHRQLVRHTPKLKQSHDNAASQRLGLGLQLANHRVRVADHAQALPLTQIEVKFPEGHVLRKRLRRRVLAAVLGLVSYYSTRNPFQVKRKHLSSCLRISQRAFPPYMVRVNLAVAHTPILLGLRPRDRSGYSVAPWPPILVGYTP